MENPEIIAYYLPQFHPFKENDEWWGKGFTEWTNVGKAKSLFKGHCQPRVPTELGYYDLRLPIIREQQAQMAREAGVTAFCYWHYWFGGKGRQLMNSIIDEVHESGSPDFPFCLGWANESWKAKQWNADGSGDKFLMEQRYEGEEDYRMHFDYVKELFKDKRYYRVEDKPFFLIYQPQEFNDMELFIKLWNKCVKEEGIAQSVYFVANIGDQSTKDHWLEMGFDAVTPAPIQRFLKGYLDKPKYQKAFIRFKNQYTGSPLCVPSSDLIKNNPTIGYDDNEDVIPFIMPQWDHSPRSGKKGRVITNATPEQFRKQVRNMLDLVKNKKNKIILLKSWNEWAECNYMEPDMLNGRGFIDVLAEELSKE